MVIIGQRSSKSNFGANKTLVFSCEFKDCHFQKEMVFNRLLVNGWSDLDDFGLFWGAQISLGF